MSREDIREENIREEVVKEEEIVKETWGTMSVWIINHGFLPQ